MTMTLNKFIRTVVILWMAGWLTIFDLQAEAARVAGEEGVASSSSQTGQGVQNPAPVKPAPVAPRQVQSAPTQRPALRPAPGVQSPPAVRPPARAPAWQRAQPGREQVAPQPSPQQPEARPSEGNAAKSEAGGPRYVTIDFDDVDIGLFIKFISELTGKNFVVDKRVQGKVTIISPAKITVDEAYKVFESVLEVYGFAAVESGNITKIIPAVEARSKDVQTLLRKEAVSPEDKIVTQLIPLTYADPNDLTKLFAPLISKTSVIVPYPPTGTLIVTDVLSNIRRLLAIVEAIDVEGIGEEVSVVPLKYAAASVMGKSLNEVFQKAPRQARQRAGTNEPLIKIVPDDRTNALVILASEDDTKRIKQLINLLDKETPRGEGDIHVYYLEHANAEDLVKVLMALPSKEVKEAEKGKAPVVSKEVQMVADKATNSLVVTAKKDDFRVLEDVIRKLDIARRMVYIEALIMEVDVAKGFDLGVEWLAGDQIGTYEGRKIGAYGASIPPASQTVLPSQNTTTGTASFPQGLSLGVLGDTITIGPLSFPTIAAAVRALQTDSDVRILSTPQILTTDNEEAEITIAENVPYVTSQQQNTVGIAYSNYEYRDVGITLKITPQINQEGLVRLKVSQEVSRLVQASAEGILAPSTLKRLAKTTVIVKDGTTVVIGGLIDETLNKTNSSVPCLGGIPALGWLFKSTSDSSDRKNLYVFLTPRVIENPAQAEKLYEQKKEEIDKVREGAIKMYQKPKAEVERWEVEEK